MFEDWKNNLWYLFTFHSFDTRSNCLRQCNPRTRKNSRPNSRPIGIEAAFDTLTEGCLQLGATLLEDYTPKGTIEKFSWIDTRWRIKTKTLFTIFLLQFPIKKLIPFSLILFKCTEKFWRKQESNHALRVF